MPCNITMTTDKRHPRVLFLALGTDLVAARGLAVVVDVNQVVVTVLEPEVGLESGGPLHQDVTLLGLDGEFGARPAQIDRHGAGGIEALDGAAIRGRLALLGYVVEAVQYAIVGGGEDTVQRNVKTFVSSLLCTTLASLAE